MTAAIASAETVRRVYPGLALCTVLALAGSFLAEHYGAPALLFALLLGLGFAGQAAEERMQAGVELCARAVLRVGVALLGARIGLDQLRAAGWLPLLIVAASMPVVLVAALAAGRMLKLPPAQSVVAAAAVAICGVSAAIAVAAALRPGALEERRLLGVVVTVAALGTAAMVLYPPLTGMLGLDATAAGIFLGASIHDVAQAAGAGYLLSELSGDAATITKLLRVTMLIPLVILVAAWQGRRRDQGAGVPPFLIGFVLLAALNSGGLLPDALRSLLLTLSQWCLLLSIAALGMRTSINGLLTLGWRPTAQMALLSVLLATFVVLVLIAAGESGGGMVAGSLVGNE